MSRFPFFKDISGWDVLIVGGGRVALRKARVLSEFGVRLHAVAPAFDEGFSEVPAERILREFRPEDLQGARLCVAATDCRAVNARVAELCRERGIEVNVSDDPSLGTFHFPAMLRRGELTVALSTSGVSPLAARWARDCIAQTLPENFGDVLERMEAARRLAMRWLPDPDVRARALARAFERCMDGGPLPADGELEGMIRAFPCTELD
ncbi:MAG TPA: bifunctional precorrin-2 dehydrogenase/sirohydrochlorin ferrochelatase [Candidatus Faecivicinus avistercoris]|nr:bifunctional precorrin-2 dehydrogenase/sirohydrochlorin ferrochelatase [Candidatus Faecivicinus avistercoris]